MVTITVTLNGVPEWDGRYELDLSQAGFVNREWGWIKRFSGYYPTTIDDAFRHGDAQFWSAVTTIALCRAGKIDKTDAAETFDRLEELPYAAIQADLRPSEDADAVPPASSNGREPSSGDGSPTGSETPETPQSPIGLLPSAISVSASRTSAS